MNRLGVKPRGTRPAPPVDGTENVGGLVGIDSGSVQSSYWDEDSSGQRSSDGDSTPLNTGEMTGTSAESNMSEFDFDSVWKTTAGYPELR